MWHITNGASVNNDGYKFEHRNRITGQRGGGVGIYYKEMFDKRRCLSIEKSIPDIEQLWLCLTAGKYKLNVVVMYRPPNQNIPEFTERVRKTLLQTYQQHQKRPTFIFGDFNIDIGKSK